jgi:hypothetical protein
MKSVRVSKRPSSAILNLNSSSNIEALANAYKHFSFKIASLLFDKNFVNVKIPPSSKNSSFM